MDETIRDIIDEAEFDMKKVLEVMVKIKELMSENHFTRGEQLFLISLQQDLAVYHLVKRFCK